MDLEMRILVYFQICLFATCRGLAIERFRQSSTHDLSNLLTDVILRQKYCSLFIASDAAYYGTVKQITTTPHPLAHIPKIVMLEQAIYATNNSLPILPGLGEKLQAAKSETCYHYIVMLEDASKLPKVIGEIYEKRTTAASKFIVVSRYLDKKNYFTTRNIQGTILSTIKNVLYITTPEVGLSNNSYDTLEESRRLDWSSTNNHENLLAIKMNKFFFGNERFQLINLATWSKGVLFSKDINVHHPSFSYYDEDLRDFHKIKLHVSTFHYPPTVIFNDYGTKQESFDGLEIRLLKTLAFALNFGLKIRKPVDGDKWGRELLNGSFSGAFGEAMRGEADISVANYFITRERLQKVDMTLQHHIDYTCFITPPSTPLPRYLVVLWPFQTEVWLVSLIFFIIIPPLFKWPWKLREKLFSTTLSHWFFLTWGIFMNQNQNPIWLPKTIPLRTLWSFVAVAALVLRVAYRSSLFSMLLLPSAVQPVNTLTDLLDSGLEWGVRDSGGWEKWFSNSIDTTAQKVAEGFYFVPNAQDGINRVVEGNFAFMNSGTFLQYLVASNFSTDNGQPKLHIAKECFIPFRIGMVLPKHSVYRKEFDKKIQKMVEAGLVNYWFQDLLTKASHNQKSSSSSFLNEDKSSKSKILNLHNLQGPFILWMMGLLVAILSFFVEACVGLSHESGVLKQEK